MFVFYFPYELNEKYDRPSLKRPLKMLNAFKEITIKGHVIEAIGKSRDLAIHQIQKDIKNGMKDEIELVYVESINKPLFLQRIMERKINIFGDYFFFWRCKKNNVPLAIFYRDALWVTKRFRTLVPRYSYYFLKLVFYIEFKLLEFLFDVFFLPSLEMAKELPFGENKILINELPPAVDIEKYQSVDEIKQRKNNGIILIYVGNINPDFYNISPIVNVVRNNSLVKLNICCRKNDWDQYNEFYKLKHIKNIHVHHVEDEKLARLYRGSDIHIMLFAEDAYRKFAVPFKFYESLQFGIPIITNDGTKVASLVHELDVGWVVSSEEDASTLIKRLNIDQSPILEKKKNIGRVVKDNTWQSRAGKVIDICKKIYV